MEKDKNTYTGIVMHGEKMGTALGFPTANITLEDSSVSGIFAAHVMTGGKVYPAAAFVNWKRKLLEAHLLDFSGDLYDMKISITLLKKIREDKEFKNKDELIATITLDAAAVRHYFQDRPL